MIRRAKTLAWCRMSESDVRRLLAVAHEMAARAGHDDGGTARRAMEEARAIASEGGMRLCEAYRDGWISGSEVPRSHYTVYRRARELTAVRVGLDGRNHVWWYRDRYFVARPDLEAPDIVRFAHAERDRERRNLERFRAELTAARPVLWQPPRASGASRAS